jgi:hypothetical protein
MPKRRKRGWGVFPELSRAIEASGSPEFRLAYRERVHAVNYHLGSVDMAARQCSTSIDARSWHMHETGDGHEITVFFDPLNIARLGDFAIREAASVIDTGLALMNHVLSLGFRPQEIIWRSFLARNPRTLEASRAIVAGEELAVYSAVDYTMAVRHVSHFVEEVVRNDWDDEIAATYSRVRGAASSNPT